MVLKKKEPYSNGFRCKVALRYHEIAGLVQFNDGPSVSLHLCLKGLMFLELSLKDGKKMLYETKMHHLQIFVFKHFIFENAIL